MDKVKMIMVKCSHCGIWNPSPFMFNEMVSFDTSKLEGNKVRCIVCNKMTSCNKENMKVSSQKGGFRGNDTF